MEKQIFRCPEEESITPSAEPKDKLPVLIGDNCSGKATIFALTKVLFSYMAYNPSLETG